MARSPKKEVKIQFATATTPAMSMVGATDKERMHLTPAEFAVQLKATSQEVKDLVKIARKVGALKSGSQLQLADGSLMGAKELNTLVSSHIKTLKQLKKNYVARGSKKKRSPTTKDGTLRKVGDGFGQPSFLSPELVAFLRTANFGNVPGTNTPLRDVLEPVLQYGILSRAIMTPLLTIYEFANGLRFEQDGKKFFRAGPEMVTNLGPYLTALEASDRAKTDAQLVDKNGKKKLRFDRNKFVYNRLQSIVNPGFRSQASLSEDEKAYVANDQIKATLAQIQQVVSAAKEVAHPSE
jgi:hypothetical protein